MISCLGRCRGTEAIHWREHRDAERIWQVSGFWHRVHAVRRLNIARESIRQNKPLPPICIHGEVESDCQVCLAVWAQSWAVKQGFPLRKCRHRRRPLECEKCRDTCIEACLRNDRKILLKVCPWWRPACLTPSKRSAAAMREETHLVVDGAASAAHN